MKYCTILITLLSLLCVPLQGAEDTTSRPAGVINPAEFRAHMPEQIGDLRRTKLPVTTLSRTRNGILQSECQGFYGTGQVLISISHLQDRNSLRSIMYRNYVAMGSISNPSIQRRIEKTEAGFVIHTVYLKAHYSETILLLDNDICIRYVLNELTPQPEIDRLKELLKLDGLIGAVSRPASTQ